MNPSFASGSQEIEDFLGVSLQSETARGSFHSLRSLKRTSFWRRLTALFLFLGSKYI
jgi:hypothetical protein